MKISDCVVCTHFPCADVNHNSHILPDIEIDPEKVRILMISEAPPTDFADFFYAPGAPDYLSATLRAFADAGIMAHSLHDILNLGVFMTTAIKCGKTGYAVSGKTIEACSFLLEREIAFFPGLQAFLLMGDVAIKALNFISKRQFGKRVIPAGSTYKIRKDEFYYEGRRAFPSYLQTGKNVLIEKSKRRMIAEDIAAALKRI